MQFLSGVEDERAMLDALGLESVDELFADVPTAVREGLSLPDGESELTARRNVTRILSKNAPFEERPHFLGAGSYHHYVPALVQALILRGEYYTAYTPYQPEILQGLLQPMFEYQTYVTRLTEMEVANVSMYDGPTALAEAALMGMRASRGKRILIPANLYWEKKSIIRNYVKGQGGEVVEFGYDPDSGEADFQDLESKVTEDTATVVLQNPNFFGVFESRADEVRGILDRKAPKALYVVDVGDPFSLGLVSGPGAYGADVAVGEGAAIGNAVSFGGPYLGIFATKWEHVRKMPGRITGETVDENGEAAYCLTFSTREQHIRRDRATSNICSNETLNAIAFSVHLAALGEQGFRDVAATNAVRARNLAERIGEVDGFRAPRFEGHTFNEFVVRSEYPVEKINAAVEAVGLRAGLDITPWHPELGNATLWCVTEAHPEWAIDDVIAALREVKA